MGIFHRKNAAWMILLPLFFCAVAPIVAMAQVAWVQGFDAALQQAAREKKFIILDISATW